MEYRFVSGWFDSTGRSRSDARSPAVEADQFVSGWFDSTGGSGSDALSPAVETDQFVSGWFDSTGGGGSDALSPAVETDAFTTGPPTPFVCYRRDGCLLVACLLTLRPSNILVYLRDGSAQTSLRAAILR